MVDHTGRSCDVIVAMVMTFSLLVETEAVGDVVPLAPSGGVYRSRYGGRCERITIPLCLDMKYNMTKMPNLVGQLNQAEAAMQVHEFVPLIQFGCSDLLKFFLCSLYAPMCTVQVDEPMVIPPCRSMCLDVRDKCEPVLRRFDFEWPAVIDCYALPERIDRGNLCIDLPPPDSGNSKDTDPASGSGPSSRVGQNPAWPKLLDEFRGGQSNSGSTENPAASGGGRGGKSGGSHRCPDRFISTAATAGSSSFNDSGDVIERRCASRCSVDVMFRAADKKFMSTWMTVWAAVSLVSSLFATLTFLVNPSRLDYPERPVIFLVICYAFYSSAFILRAIAGAELVSCDQTGNEPQSLPPEVERYVIREGLESVWCLAVFLILYYFSTAGAVWWTMLAISWFLASARKWSRESIRSYAGYIHLVGWSVPAVQTIVVLAIRRVDGDELTGMCYVGNQDSAALAAFVLAPQSIYLAVGIALIGLGFLALFGVRHDLKRTDRPPGGATAAGSSHVTSASSSDVRKLDKLMARIGLFSAVYVVAMCCHLAAVLYQQVRVGESMASAMRTPCHAATAGLDDLNAIQLSCALTASLQSVEVHALKVCSPLLIGIASGLWMMSPKTLRSWSTFVCRCRRHDTGNSTSTQRLRQADVGIPADRFPTTRTSMTRHQTAPAGRTSVNRNGTMGGRCSKNSSYAALNKGGALSLTTII